MGIQYIPVFVFITMIASFSLSQVYAEPEPVAEPEMTSEAEPAFEPEAKSEAAQSSGGCGTGTVLVDGVCQLAPIESSGGCGQGTVLVDGVCQLAETGSPFNVLSGTTIEPLFIVIGAVAVGGGIVGIVFAVRRGSSGAKTPKPARQDLDDYESQHLSRQRIEPSPKPAEKKETSMFCDNCGAAFKNPEAKFCGECGTQRA